MLGRYRLGFFKLATLLNRLDTTSEDAANVCFEIQQELIPRIIRVERRIRHWKRTSPQTEKTREAVKTYQRIAKTLRYFGDAIAFTYMDRWDIKAMSQGNASGFISGKEGFKLEKTILKSVTDRGIAAVLTDLTNWLRHGDLLCFGPKRLPIIFEVKERKSKRSGRSQRQKKRLDRLVKYLDTDETEYQGMTMRRVSLPSEVVEHSSVMARVAERAVESGTAFEAVNDNLVYIAIKRVDDELFDKLAYQFVRPTFFTITSDEYVSMGYPYYPITLVLKKPEVLAEFLSENLVLGIAFDFSQLEKSIESRGASMRMLEPKEDDPWALELTFPDGSFLKVSYPMFYRLFYEFLDIDWFAEVLSQPPEELVGDVAEPPENQN